MYNAYLIENIYILVHEIKHHHVTVLCNFYRVTIIFWLIVKNNFTGKKEMKAETTGK